LWALARADLMAEPPEARLHSRHRMVLAQGEPLKTPQNNRSMARTVRGAD